MPVLIRTSRLSKEDKKKYPNSNGAIIIIIYSESHFEGFYNKHCGRADTESLEYTTLVVNEIECPRKTDLRRDFEKLFVSEKFPICEGTILVRLPPQYKARIYSGTEDIFLDETAGKGNFKIRNCKKLTSPIDYVRLIEAGEITQKEANTVNSIKEWANHENIAVKFVLFIGHINVIKFR